MKRDDWERKTSYLTHGPAGAVPITIRVAAVRISVVAAIIGLVHCGRGRAWGVCLFGRRTFWGWFGWVGCRSSDSARGEKDSESKDLGVLHLGFFNDGSLRVKKWKVDYDSWACCGRCMIAERSGGSGTLDGLICCPFMLIWAHQSSVERASRVQSYRFIFFQLFPGASEYERRGGRFGHSQNLGHIDRGWMLNPR